MADVKFTATVDVSQAVPAVQKLETAFKGLEGGQKEVAAAASETGSKFSSLSQDLIKTGVLVAAAYKGYQILKQGFFDSIGGAADFEKSLKGLNAAFDISGRTMPGMVGHLKDYAARLMELGLAEDEDLMKTESMTMQLTQLDEQGIKAVTRGAIGLAAVFGYDLQSATEMLSRGMEGQYFALNRLFPAIRNATGETEKHAALMKIMEGLYQRAVADTGTYSGQLKRLGIEFKEMERHLGEAILASGILQAAMEGAGAAVAFVEKLLGRQTQAEIDHNEAEMEALGILQQVAEATNHGIMWINQLTNTYHLNYEQLLEWIRANMLGTAEMKAAEVAVKAHNAAVDAAKRPYTETGKVVETFYETTARMWEQAHQHARALIDDAVATKLAFTPLPVPGFQFYFADQATEEEKRIRAVASLIVNDIQGISKSAETEGKIFDQAFGNMLSKMITFGTGTGSVFKQVGSIFGEFVKSMVAGFELLVVKQMWEAAKTVEAEKIKAAARAVAKVFDEIPFPFDLVVAVAAFAAVNALFGKLFKAAQGFEGIVSQPTMFLAGEAGPESVSVRPMSRAGAPAFAAAGGMITVNINSPLVTTSGLADSDLAAAGSRLLEVIKRELRRYGRGL